MSKYVTCDACTKGYVTCSACKGIDKNCPQCKGAGKQKCAKCEGKGGYWTDLMSQAEI